jgi:hypothetical protein
VAARADLDRTVTCTPRHLSLAAVAALGAYRTLVRPRWSRWGSTPDEMARSLPGDDLVTCPHSVTTRSVTIRADPTQVWPWLVQMGDGRGGLYSYDWLDQLFGFISGPSANIVLPEHQRLEVGDVIPLGRGTSWPVVLVARDRYLVLEPVPGGVTWCFFLSSTCDGATRLISRVRVGLGPKALLYVLSPMVDAPWFFMERKMLLGIKTRAEALAAESGSVSHLAPQTPVGASDPCGRVATPRAAVMAETARGRDRTSVGDGRPGGS